MNELSALLFMLGNLVRLMKDIPSTEDSWMDYDSQEGEHPNEVHLQIRGMPFRWKIINALFILLPKLFLWKATAECGIIFLMETATISDAIVNCTALVFILNTDELIFSTVSSDYTKHMMERLAGYPIVASEMEVDLDDEASVLAASNMNSFLSRRTLIIRAPLVVAVWAILVMKYYLTMCKRGEDGTWISISAYTPLSTDLSFFELMLPSLFGVPHEKEPYWTMPGN